MYVAVCYLTLPLVVGLITYFVKKCKNTVLLEAFPWGGVISHIVISALLCAGLY